MALVLADRVRDTTTTTGTGAVTLSGTAPVGYQTFGAAVGDGNTTYYTIAAVGGAAWEIGIGTYSATGLSLSRDTVLASSAGGAKVSFAAGDKEVFVTYPAQKSIADGYGTLPVTNGGTNSTASPTAGGVSYGTGSAYAFTAAGAAGQVLLSNGSSAPSFGGIDGGTF